MYSQQNLHFDPIPHSYELRRCDVPDYNGYSDRIIAKMPYGDMRWAQRKYMNFDEPWYLLTHGEVETSEVMADGATLDVFVLKGTSCVELARDYSPKHLSDDAAILTELIGLAKVVRDNFLWRWEGENVIRDATGAPVYTT